MTDLNKSASEPLAQRAVSEQPAQELGFDNELIRFAVFHTNGSIWEAADVLYGFESRPDKGNAVGLLEFALWISENDQIKALKILARLTHDAVEFRSGTPARSDMQKTPISIKSVEKSNNETTQKQSTLEEVMKEMAESAEGASTIANAVEEAKATLPSNKSASIVRSGEGPTSSWSPGLQSHQSKSKQLASLWKRDIRSATRLPAQKTTMSERQHFRMSNNIQDNKTQKATDPTDSKGKMVATAIQTETIIATPTVSSHTQSKAFTAAIKKEVIDVRTATSNPQKSASCRGIKRKLEIIEISDDDGDGDGAADVNRHDLIHLKKENNATENIAAEDASAKGDLIDDSLTDKDLYVNFYDSTDEQEPNLLPLVNEGVWRSKKMTWADELFQKSKFHIRVSGHSSPHHAKCFKEAFKRKQR
ncbi:hypothetical protein BPAE_0050g00060 [Botrytis paeoniae]|uniref:Uncharacterized protein n=1 Tax=Botrytis paeoniae TaxID=278948 RepID=A0A4Z1FQD7_9HELO|nr:hypothetical protein BPAE_0050g00060 [Botrytis paeoniae]